MKKSIHSILDQETIKLMDALNIKPKQCKYCKGEFYPHKNTTAEQWEAQEFCSSICNGNFNVKPFRPTLTK